MRIVFDGEKYDQYCDKDEGILFAVIDLEKGILSAETMRDGKLAVVSHFTDEGESRLEEDGTLITDMTYDCPEEIYAGPLNEGFVRRYALPSDLSPSEIDLVLRMLLPFAQKVEGGAVKIAKEGMTVVKLDGNAQEAENTIQEFCGFVCDRSNIED